MSAESDVCPICFHRFKDPYMVICCGQSFCRFCLQESLIGNNQCPMCRKANPKFGPNRVLAELMSESSEQGVSDLEDNELQDFSQRRHLVTPTRKRSQSATRARALWTRFTFSCERCWVWLRVQEERLRCLFYVCSLALLVLYLRIEEEAYQEQEQDPMSRDQKRIGHRPAAPSVPSVPDSESHHHHHPHSSFIQYKSEMQIHSPYYYHDHNNESGGGPPSNYYCDRDCRITVIDTLPD